MDEKPKTVVGDSEYSNPQPDVYLKTHAPSVCAGQNCCIHNPSDHPMRNWALVHRTDDSVIVEMPDDWSTRTVGARTPPRLRYMVISERVCEHGIGHPDPDSLAWLYTQVPSYPWEDHPCDGCCGTLEEEGSNV